MTVARALGFTRKPTGLPASKAGITPEPEPEGEPRRWVVRGVLEVEHEVWASDPDGALREARTALEDVAARIDAMPGMWAAGGDLADPEEVTR